MQDWWVAHHVARPVLRHVASRTCSSDKRQQFCYEQQQYLLHYLSTLKDTQYGRDHHLNGRVDNFLRETHPHRYEEVACYVTAPDGIWPDALSSPADGRQKFYAISGWTTSFGTENKKKILVPPEVHTRNQQVFADIFDRYTHRYPDSRLLNHTLLSLGGAIRYSSDSMHMGDVSALLMMEAEKWVGKARQPYSLDILTGDWEAKYAHMLQTVHTKSVGALLGVTSWLAMFLDELQEKYPQHYAELKKTLECVVWWGVDIGPYRDTFERHGIERTIGVYNAAEWVLGYQDLLYHDDVRYLFAQTGFYELAPRSSFDEQGAFKPWSVVFPLYELSAKHMEEYGDEYVIVYSPPGQVRTIMDRVRISVDLEDARIAAVRFCLTWRVCGFINLVGEELMEQQVSSVMHALAQEYPLSHDAYTVAPLTKGDGASPARHEWVIERAPGVDLSESVDRLSAVDTRLVERLDALLCDINGDYNDKRTTNWLTAPLVHIVPAGTFATFMQEHEKWGWQNKILHMSPERTYIERLLASVRSS